MPRRIVPALVVAVAGLTASGVPARVSGEAKSEIVIDRVVAVVDHIPITLVELDQKSAYATSGLRDKPLADRLDEERAAKRQVLSEMIDNRILSMVATANEISVSDAEIDAAIDAVIERNGLSAASLDEQLRTSGWSHDAYRDAIHGELLRQKIIELKVAPKIRNARAMTPEAYSAALDQAVRAYLDEERAAHFVEDRL